MKICRLVPAFIMILAMTVAGWAAKKQSSAPAAHPTKVQESASERATAKISSSPSVSVTTKVETPAVVDQKNDELTPPRQAGSAAAYEIPWQSVNGGGGPMTSPSYQVNSSVGQPAIGFATSTNYQAGIGYWYGTSAAGGGCSCPFQCDYDADGFLTALDLGSLIDVLFAGLPEVTDPGCPTSRGDFDCDLFPTAIDLGKLIDHLFAGGIPPCDPCNP